MIDISVVVSVDNERILSINITKSFEDIFFGSVTKILDQLIINRQIWCNYKKITNTPGFVEVIDHCTHKSGLTYTRSKSKTQWWKRKIKVRKMLCYRFYFLQQFRHRDSLEIYIIHNMMEKIQAIWLRLA